MANKKYPAKRKPALVWECPICKKSMSVRGKVGHLELIHGKKLPPKENDPFPLIKRKIVLKKRPLAKADVRNLLSNIKFLVSLEKPNNLLSKRKVYLQCEYLVRELEIQFDCTLKEALNKFPDLEKTG